MKKKVDKLAKDVSRDLSSLEETVRKQGERKRIETALLGTVSMVGLASVAIFAPNAIQVLHKAFPDLRPVGQKQSVKNAIGRLIKKGFIEKSEGGYRITKKGDRRFEELEQASNYFGIPDRKWDKKWRVVLYDISEKQRDKRDMLRSALVRTGFVRLQDSAWVYPFRCDEVVSLLKFKLKLGRSAVYIIADAIENDEWLRDYFSLPEE